MAKCPSHDDKSPSLSIREGRKGRTLVCCFAGCPLSAILKAAGLRLGDLFAGPPPSPAQKKAADRERERIAVLQDERRANRIQDTEFVRKLERRLDNVVREEGRELALTADDAPQGPALTASFHDAVRAYQATAR